MTYVASGRVTGSGTIAWTSPSLLVGDALACFFVGSEDFDSRGASVDRMPSPGTGWVRRMLESVTPTGRPSQIAGFAQGWTYVPSAAGTVSATFSKSAPYFGTDPSVELFWIHLRDVKAVQSVAVRRQSNQRFVYDGANFSPAASGHVIDFAMFRDNDSASTYVPAGSTYRQGAADVHEVSFGYGYQVYGSSLSDKTFTSTTSVASAQASNGTTDGFTVALYFLGAYAPRPPVVQFPTGSAANLAAGFTLRWMPDGSQSHFAARRKQGAGAYQWWNGSTWGASSETWIASTTPSLVVPSGQFPSAGESFVIEVATKGAPDRPDGSTYGTWSGIAIGAPAAPTVSVSDVSGGLLAAPRPTITLTGSATTGATLTGRVFTLAQGGVDVWTSGIVTGTAPYKLPVAAAQALTPLSAFTLRSALVQNSTVIGAQTSTALTANWALPAAPGVMVERTADETSDLPGISLTVTTTVNGWGEVQRNGEPWWYGPITGSFTLLDFLAQSDAELVYSVRVLDPLDGLNVASPWSTTAPTALDNVLGWLFDPLDGSTAVRMSIVAFGAEEDDLRAGGDVPLDSSAWIVHSGVAADPTGSMVLRSHDPAAVESARAMLRSGRRLILRLGNERNYRTGVVSQAPDLSFRPVGPLQVDRVEQLAWTRRDISVKWVRQ